MIIFIVIVLIVVLIIFLYCCIVVASRADQEIELYRFKKDLRKARDRFLEEREKENG